MSIREAEVPEHGFWGAADLGTGLRSLEGTLTCVRVQSAWARMGGRARGCSPEEGSVFGGGCGEETVL